MARARSFEPAMGMESWIGERSWRGKHLPGVGRKETGQCSCRMALEVAALEWEQSPAALEP